MVFVEAGEVHLAPTPVDIRVLYGYYGYMTIIGEKITAAVVFKNGMILPKKFIWNGRELKVNKIDLNYSKRVGNVIMRFFSVEVFEEDGAYQLSFNTNDMIWRLDYVCDAC